MPLGVERQAEADIPTEVEAAIEFSFVLLFVIFVLSVWMPCARVSSRSGGLLMKDASGLWGVLIGFIASVAIVTLIVALCVALAVHFLDCGNCW